MKKLKTSFIMMAFVIVSSFFLSCQKDNSAAIATDSEVEFAISNSHLKNSPGYNMSDADKIVLTIQFSDGTPTKYTDSEIKIEQMNGNYYTKKITLKTDNYKLVKFLIIDAGGNTIFTTPLIGSQEAPNVDSPLPINFTVTKDVTTPVSVQVLSTENKSPEDFGLSHFPIVEVKTFGFMIGVADKETGVVLSSKLTVSNGTYSYIQDLTTILNNVVTVKDELTDYTVTVEKLGYVNYTHTFTIAEIKTYLNDVGNGPLLVELEKELIVTDIDGNIYHTVAIGTQIWMVENLKTSKYNDGTPITLINDNIEWTTAGAAYCWYNNDPMNYKETYGALYNWYVIDPVSNGGKIIAPIGWHVPTDAEWTILTTYLGGESVAGGKMKESPFTALLGGNRYWGAGTFGNMDSYGLWWSSTALDENTIICRYLTNDENSFRSNVNIHDGISLRCLKD